MRVHTHICTHTHTHTHTHTPDEAADEDTDPYDRERLLRLQVVPFSFSFSFLFFFFLRGGRRDFDRERLLHIQGGGRGGRKGGTYTLANICPSQPTMFTFTFSQPTIFPYTLANICSSQPTMCGRQPTILRFSLDSHPSLFSP
jgi:hypothetical protein